MLKPNFLYNQVCVLNTATEVNDKGSISITFSSGSAIPCRAVEASATEQEKYGKKAAERGYRFHIDVNTEVKENDTITFLGNTYNVEGVNPHHSMSVYQTIYAFKVLED